MDFIKLNQYRILENASKKTAQFNINNVLKKDDPVLIISRFLENAFLIQNPASKDNQIQDIKIF